VNDPSSFKLKVATSEVAKPYDIVFLREGKERTATIVPVASDKVVFEQERNSPKSREIDRPENKTIADFGLEVQPLTPELAKQLETPAATKGLLVTSVKEGSSAAEKGIKEGDVIVSVISNRRFQPMTSVKAFQEMAAKSNELAVKVQRGPASRTVVLSKTTK